MNAWRLSLPQDDSPDRQVRPLLMVLGLPTFGLAFAITILTTYGPVILLNLSGSPGTVGPLLGGEGALALDISLVAGAMSDRLRPRGLGVVLGPVLVGYAVRYSGAIFPRTHG